MILLCLCVTQKALQLPFFFVLLYFYLLSIFGETVKSFLANVLALVIKKACDQDLTHSLGRPKGIFVNIFPKVVIRDACGT